MRGERKQMRWAVVAITFLAGSATELLAQRDPGFNQPGAAGNTVDPGFNQPGAAGNRYAYGGSARQTRVADPGWNQPGAAGNVTRDRGVNQPGAAGNVAGRDPGVNQPGTAGNRRR
jgi:hypothetical protein